MILKHYCESKQQDKLHGYGMRVFNPTAKKEGSKIVYRCTVCNGTQAMGSESVPEGDAKVPVKKK